MNFEAPFETQESYVKESKTKIIWLSLTAIFIICGILMAIFHPEAEFTWLVESTKYYLALFFVAVVCIFMWLAQLGERRNEKYYFTPEGKLDLSTPRFYSKLKRPKLIEIFNRGGLDEFAYDGEGNVYLVTSKGKTITAPLSELTVKYTMDKVGRDEWRIYKMKVATPEGEKIKFTTGSTLLPFPALMDAEYDDIHMILSTAGTLKESKTSKASKWANKINSAYNYADFSGFFGKSDKNVADNKVIGFVKAKVGVNQKKKSWFKRAMEYFWLTVGILFVVIVLIINISALPEIFRGVDKQYDEYIQGLEDENLNYSENEEIPSDDDKQYDEYIQGLEDENLNYSENEEIPSDDDGYDPTLSTRKLTTADLSGKSKKDLEIMRNSIYARYGYKFKRKDLLNYFSQFLWYAPSTSDMSAAYKRMSSIEKYNIEFIKKHE